jgi:acyl dehydratase
MDAFGHAVDIELPQTLHGEEQLRLERSLPAQGSIELSGRITGISDKGKAAVVGIETTGHDSNGVLFSVYVSLYIMGAGGFGGDHGDLRPREDKPEGPVDHVIEQHVPTSQAALYRLSGDRNPMHIDPDFAGKAGFDGPFLHGLCTYGFVGRAIGNLLAGGDDSELERFNCRFADQVWPGDRLLTQVWVNADGHFKFETKSDRGVVVLSHGGGSLRSRSEVVSAASAGRGTTRD